MQSVVVDQGLSPGVRVTVAMGTNRDLGTVHFSRYPIHLASMHLENRHLEIFRRAKMLHMSLSLLVKVVKLMNVEFWFIKIWYVRLFRHLSQGKRQGCTGDTKYDMHHT